MSTFRDRVATIKSNMSMMQLQLTKFAPNKGLECSDAARLFDVYIDDLQSAIDDEPLYSERTKKGNARTVGTHTIDEGVEAVQFQGCAVHVYNMKETDNADDRTDCDELAAVLPGATRED